MKKYTKGQRILALSGAIFLVILYLAAFITAFLNFEGSGRLFQICLFSTVAIPLFLYCNLFLYRLMKKNSEDDTKDQ